MRNGQELRDRRPSFRELEALHALVEARKTTSAAHKLGVSQPAISRAIQDLEHRLGKILFRREGGRLVATQDGIQLYHDSQPVFQALDRLGQVPGALADGETIRLIAPPTIAHRFLPQMVADFNRAEPGTRLHLEIGITADIIAKMADGNFDIGITDSQLHHPSVFFEPFRRSTSHAVMAADHPLAAKQEITPADLHLQPFIALSRRISVRSIHERIFQDAGSEPRIVIEAATSAIAYELVRRGAGITLINPFPVAFRGDADVVIRPFTPKVPFETSFVLSTAAPATRAVRRFIDFVRRHQAEDGYSFPIR
jgi:DNA-binding transcriptional LysR family regulator